MRIRASKTIGTALLVLSFSDLAFAFPSYLTAFKNKYPSTTLDARLGCTLCHTQESYALNVNCYRKALNLLGNQPIDQRINTLDSQDSDGDGIANGIEAVTARPDGGVGFAPGLKGSTGVDPCGANPNKAVSGVCESPKDTDGDGTIDCFDGCPNDAGKTSSGTCGCGVADVDSDGDGKLNCVDLCPGVSDTLDANSDGVPDCLEGPSFQVNSTVDSVDATPGDGNCADSQGRCTLRAAIMEANANPNRNIIQLPAGTYTLTLTSGSSDPARGDLNVESNLSIVGAGAATTTINAGGIDRALNLGSFQRLVFISNVTIKGGRFSGFAGAGIFSNDNKLTMTNCVLTDNEVTGTGPNGGGIFAGGELTMTNCAVHANKVTQTGGTDGYGAGVYCTFGGKATLKNCTISGNIASGTGTKGGGVAIFSNTVSITNCTIASNQATAGAGGIYYNGGGFSTFTLKLGNTIIAGNTAANCEYVSPFFTSLGHNLDDGNSCGLNASGDLTNTPAQLGALLNNGAGLPTQMPDAMSPAIDAGLDSLAGSTDQRGFPRPRDGNNDGASISDIGAAERADCDRNGTDDGREIVLGVVFADCNNNGTPDACENATDCDSNGTIDSCQTDTDGDGTVDACDPCPNGGSSADTDGDGTRDCSDMCPNDAAKLAPGLCGCGVVDADPDGDGLASCVDNCDNVVNPDQADSNADGIGDACPGDTTSVDFTDPSTGGESGDGSSGGSGEGSGGTGTGESGGVLTSGTGTGATSCGAGACGAGTTTLMPLTLIALARSRRRRLHAR